MILTSSKDNKIASDIWNGRLCRTALIKILQIEGFRIAKNNTAILTEIMYAFQYYFSPNNIFKIYNTETTDEFFFETQAKFFSRAGVRRMVVRTFF